MSAASPYTRSFSLFFFLLFSIFTLCFGLFFYFHFYLFYPCYNACPLLAYRPKKPGCLHKLSSSKPRDFPAA